MLQQKCSGKWTSLIFGVTLLLSVLLLFLKLSVNQRNESSHSTIRITSRLPADVEAIADWPEQEHSNDDELNIFMIWTTARNTFKHRNRQVIDSYLYHHPRASIRIIASDLNDSDFAEYTRLGYKVYTQQLNDEYLFQLSAGCPMASAWIDRIDQWKLGPYYYSHITDFMRFCLLYQFAGVYSDFDAILLQPLPNSPNFIGKDYADSEGKCSWCLMDKRSYLAPGVMAVSQTHHPLLEAVLRNGFNPDLYNPKDFSALGPRAITLAYTSLLTQEQSVPITVLEHHILYPYTFSNANDVVLAHKDSNTAVERLMRKSMSLHFFGHSTRYAQVHNASILAAAISRFSVIERTLPNRLICPGYLPIGTGTFQFKSAARLLSNDEDKHILYSLRVSTTTDKSQLRLSSDANHSNTLKFNALVSVALVNEKLSNLQYRLPWHIKRDEISIEIDIHGASSEASSETLSCRIPVYNPNALVTVMTKTFGRIQKVFQLAQSIRKSYPFISIIASDDSESARQMKSGGYKLFDYLSLPYDIGLSAGRNIMHSLVETEYFMTVDDDFLFDENSLLEGLLIGLERGNLDLAAGKSPNDEIKYAIDFSGLFVINGSSTERTLYLVPGSYGKTEAGCNRVDFVPNLFISRTSLSKSLKWDESLKLGEHEDYFMRAKQNGVRVGTCSSVSFSHQQSEHSPHYTAMRDRIHQFWAVALRKHGLSKMVSFHEQMIDLNMPKPIKCLSARDILPTVLTLDYEGCAEGAVNFKIAHSTDDRLYTTVNGGLGNNYRDRKECIVRGLVPGREYTFVVYAGNGREFESTGRFLKVKTPTYEQSGSLVLNSGFENGHFNWKAGMGSLFHIVNSTANSSSPTDHSLFAGRLQITHSGYLSNRQTLSSFYQNAIIPKNSRTVKSLLVSGQSKIERLYGFESEVSLGIQVRFADGGVFESKEQFEVKFNSVDWQIRSFHVCLSPDHGQIAAIRVFGTLYAYRGSALFDDVYVKVTEYYDE